MSSQNPNPTYPDSKKFKIFFSYGRDANADFVAKLYHYLKDNHSDKFEIWYDKESLSAGGPFQLEIFHAIRTSNCMLLFMSEHSAKSPYCKMEWQTANRGMITILPISLEYSFKELSDPTNQKAQESIVNHYLPIFLQSNGVEALVDKRDAALEEIYKRLEIERERQINNPRRPPELKYYLEGSEPAPLYSFQQREEEKEVLQYFIKPVDPNDPDFANPSVQSMVYLISGQPGIGKSVLMQNLIKQKVVKNYHDFTYYVNFPADGESIEELTIGAKALEDLASHKQPTVIVLDGVQDQKTIDKFSSVNNPNTILFAVSRNPHLLPALNTNRRIGLRPFPRETVIDIFEKRRGVNFDSPNAEHDAYIQTLLRLIELLDGHPRAIQLALTTIDGKDNDSIEMYVRDIETGVKFIGVDEDQQIIYRTNKLALESISDTLARDNFCKVALLAAEQFGSRFANEILGIKNDDFLQAQRAGLIELYQGKYIIHVLTKDLVRYYLREQGVLKQIIEEQADKWDAYIKQIAETGKTNKAEAKDMYQRYASHLLYFFSMVYRESSLEEAFLLKMLELVTELRSLAVKFNFPFSDRASIAYRGALLAEKVLELKGLATNEDSQKIKLYDKAKEIERKRAVSNLTKGQKFKPDSEEGQLYQEWYDHLRIIGLSLRRMGQAKAEKYSETAIDAAEYLENNHHNISGAYQNLASVLSDVIGDLKNAYLAEQNAMAVLDKTPKANQEGEEGFENYSLRKLRLMVNQCQTLSDFLYTFLHPMKRMSGLRKLFNSRRDYEYSNSSEKLLAKLKEKSATEEIALLEGYIAYRQKLSFADLFGSLEFLTEAGFIDSAEADARVFAEQFAKKVEAKFAETRAWGDKIKTDLKALALEAEDEADIVGEIDYWLEVVLAIEANHLITKGNMDAAEEILVQELKVLEPKEDEDDTSPYLGSYLYFLTSNADFDEAYRFYSRNKDGVVGDVESVDGLLDSFGNVTNAHALVDDLELMLEYYQEPEHSAYVREKNSAELLETIHKINQQLELLKTYRIDR